MRGAALYQLLLQQVPATRAQQGLLGDFLSSAVNNSKWTPFSQLWRGPCNQTFSQQRLLSSGPAASSGAGAGSAAGPSSSSASSTRPASRLNTIAGLASRSPGATAAAAAGAPGAGASGGAAAAAAAISPAGWLAGHREALAAIPMAPKLLGFAGAIPFICLTPFVVESLGLHAWVADLARAQVNYGCLIVTFLGAVHWGLAMSTTISSPGRAAAMLRERYIWSVFPSLAAWPILQMETAPGSLLASLLLGLCYLSDRSYAKLGSLPVWYHTLRGWLTTLAMLSTLSTTVYFVEKDISKARARMEEEERARAAAEAEEAARKAQAEAAAAQQQKPAGRGKR